MRFATTIAALALASAVSVESDAERKAPNVPKTVTFNVHDADISFADKPVACTKAAAQSPLKGMVRLPNIDRWGGDVRSQVAKTYSQAKKIAAKWCTKTNNAAFWSPKHKRIWLKNLVHSKQGKSRWLKG